VEVHGSSISPAARTIQVALQQWLVIDDVVTPRCLISVVSAVHTVTGETLVRYRVDRWVLQRERRWPLGYYELLQEAVDVYAYAGVIDDHDRGAS